MRRALTVLLLTATATSCSAIEEAYRVAPPSSVVQTTAGDAPAIPPQLARATDAVAPVEQSEAVRVLGADGAVVCRLGGCSFSAPEGFRVLRVGPGAIEVLAKLQEAAPNSPVEMLTSDEVMALVIAPAEPNGHTGNVVVIRTVLDELDGLSEDALRTTLLKGAASDEPGSEAHVVAVPDGLYGWGVLKVTQGGPDSAVPVPQRQLMIPRPDGTWLVSVTAVDGQAVTDLATEVFTSLTFA